tara:strand:+ start:3337 stop:3528 length:192 start_codon:yes stop_codon:yes gene_type:complete
MEFFCHYCKLWITDTVHEQHHHNDIDEPDERRDWRVRVDGVIYEDEEEFEAKGSPRLSTTGGM